MSSSVTSSSVLAASGVDVLVPFHLGGSSTPLISSSSTPVTSNVRQRSLSHPPPGITGLLNSRSLIQATEDEKLVVATLATLDSGSASSLIKQDLKLIIQSRRKAEGKEEIQVEFKKPARDELTSEEVTKRMRRRELNRLAARRSREKGQKRKDKLVEEIKLLQSQNSKLVNDLTFLTDQRDNIINTLRQHMKQCSDYESTRNAAIGLPSRIMDMLGFLHEPPSSTLSSDSQLPSEDRTPSSLAISNLHIDITPSNSSSSTVIAASHNPHNPQQSTPLTTSQNLSYASCPPSPVILGLTGTPLLGGEGPLSPSVISGPFHFTPSSSSSSSQPIGQSSAPAMEEEMSRLSQDSATPPFSPPLNSPRKSRNQSIHHHHHSPRQESAHSSKTHRERKNETEFTRPTSPDALHPTRFLLERSFSCPSSSSNREHFYHEESSSSSQSVLLDSEDMSSLRVHSNTSSSSYSSVPGSRENRHYSACEQEAPLDLVVRSNSNTVTDDSDDSSSSLFSMDTWPRRSSGRPGMMRGVGRRWSVDDQHSAHLREPLNLSTKHEK